MRRNWEEFGKSKKWRGNYDWIEVDEIWGNLIDFGKPKNEITVLWKTGHQIRGFTSFYMKSMGDFLNYCNFIDFL